MTAVLIAIGLFTIASAAVAMTLRNLIHSALCLTLNWLGIAAFYLWAGAEFLAFAQVLVYVGAVSMVVLFAVLLTRHSRDGEDAVVGREALRRATAGVVTAGAVGGVLAAVVVSTQFVDASASAHSVTVREIGTQLMGPHVAALFVVGLLLTVALIGAVVIAARERSTSAE